ncbi:MAG: ABC transporter permease [Lachnospiraceae bacterium]|nr:ABC transporter permease [Lachnospiraceae bacterium]
MLNMIKMDMYRMFKAKSLYVIWCILICLLFLSTWLTKTEYQSAVKNHDEYRNETVEEGEESEDDIVFGIQTVVPTEVGEDITVFDMLFANISGKDIALFLVIFAVIFATADIGSGYIKNFGGQVKRREGLIVSKALALLVFTGLTLLITFLTQAISNFIVLGYLKWGDAGSLFRYMGLQILLHFALAMIIMTISILARNNVFSMIFAICLCMNMMVIVYSGIQMLLKKIGLGNLNLMKYTVTDKIGSLSMNFSSGVMERMMVISLIYIGITAVISMFIYRKRDMC